MNFLLDTCVISELIKPQQNKKVIDWINSCSEGTLFLSSLTIGEIQKGISKLPVSKKKSKLQNWLAQSLFERFERKILPIDYIVAQKWGEILSSSEKKGFRLPAIDSLIAATAIVNNMTLVTRNINDMVYSGVSLYNPWE
ncbi:MAG: PilT protein domain-containing protein [Candidatus Magnetoglobus multicellularis str. Araruama]|uniref:PilT protein domain-containing protein n=1 Tax=Candidatus Magnetoglobus multicellularis str. Araruama TaxID=890399 RepID=A0A1V1P5W0_9BACT|nr:MAG: PilT protein domain-containing protein [Candidatus Magnetoglobus multicellularis str. Araruama]